MSKAVLEQPDQVSFIDRLKTYEDVQKAIDALGIAIRALGFYAMEKNWGDDDWGVRSVVQPPEYGDPGKKARNALKRIEKLVARD